MSDRPMELHASKAIMLHQYTKQSQLSHNTALVATLHDVEFENQSPTIKEGQLMTVDDVLSMLSLIAEQREYQPLQMLPENVLAIGKDSMVWYAEPRIRRMYYRLDKKLMKFTVPWPGLVFKIKNGELSVAAVRKKRKPKADDKLYFAPLMNIYNNHKVCTGMADCPEKCELDDRAGWESVIYDTSFSHTQHNHPHTLSKKYGKDITTRGLFNFWKKLKDKKQFPLDALHPDTQTLEEWIIE